MSWSVSQFDGEYVVLPREHVGEQVVTIGPHRETDDADAVTGGLDDAWTLNGSYLQFSKAGVETITFYFRLYGNEGSLGANCSALELTMDYRLYNTAGAGAIIYYRDEDLEAWSVMGIMAEVASTEPFKRFTYAFSAAQITKLEADNNGILALQIVTDAANPVLQLDRMVLTATFNVASGYSTLIGIVSTDNSVYTDFDKAFRYENGVGYTDETVDLSDSGAGDVQLLPNPLSDGDAFYFGCDSEFTSIRLTISQAGVYDATLTWQYWNGAWTALSDVDDDTSGFEAAAGTRIISWTPPTDWATAGVNGVTKYWIKANISSYVSITTTPLATQGWAATTTSNRLCVDTDLAVSGLGLWETCNYCIAKPIYKHIKNGGGETGTIVTGGDVLYTLTANSNIETTSGISLRHYTERSRLEWLQDLRLQDKAVFWIPLGTTEMTWKSTFNNGSPTAMTDGSVLKWTQSIWDWKSVYNEYHVYGIRINDNQVNAEDHDTTSKSTYGIYRTKVLSNTGLLTDYDASQLADKLVTRDKDCQLYLQAELGGLSSLRLGDEVSITSTYLGLSASKYVITHWRYDSRNYRTHIRLYPRTAASTIGFQEAFDFSQVRSLDQLRRTSDSDRYIGDLTTQTW